MVACQEIGHTLGLAHTNEVKTDKNTGSCMDYTNDPTGTRGTNGTLANTAPNSVDFAALNAIYATVNTTQLPYTKPTYFAGHGYTIDGNDADVGFSLVPEPASWALLVAGFGMVGANLRRRERPVAA
ncbi:PEPxxWA-CTERM sorting domain-containing protein [Sphingosinicellaceae bacterium]|nr:PEPxxWA-CTERM sorting domain-containing protein [Sphingosinicellaceae bacterium]